MRKMEAMIRVWLSGTALETVKMVFSTNEVDEGKILNFVVDQMWDVMKAEKLMQVVNEETGELVLSWINMNRCEGFQIVGVKEIEG